MHRALWCLALTTSAAAIPSTVWADELQRVGIEGGFFVYSEQEALWIKGTPEAARTSVRLGYGIESQQRNLSFQAGPRFNNGVNDANRTD